MQRVKNVKNWLKICLGGLAIAFLAFVAAGCATLSGVDGAIESAEKAHQSAVVTVRTFLAFEYANEALVKAKAPEVHQVANDLRIAFKTLPVATWDAIQLFKATRAADDKISMDLKLAELSECVAKAKVGNQTINTVKK